VKSALAVVAIVACGRGASALAIRLGDRQTLVAPPDAVLESFARSIGEGRYGIAPRYLSDAQGSRFAVRGSRSEMVRARFAPRAAELGDVNTVEAEIEWMDQARASARATIDAARGDMVLRAALIWDGGVWAIEGLPEEAR